MKKHHVRLFTLACALAMALGAQSFPKAQSPQRAPAGPQIQLAILLDTSGSMDGLIDQARSRIWKIVNELALARKNGKSPRLQVALYEYGQSSIPAAQGYLRRIVPLSNDLDRVSEELFRLRTNGGDEYCGQVIRSAAHELEWSAAGNDLKMIVIAGNEPFTQGAIDYRDSCREAIRRGIVVNTIFCGSHAEGVSSGWKAGADLADGQYVAIDADNAPPPVSAPQDAEIARLGRELNGTYIAYGLQGAISKRRQDEQDKLAAAAGGMVMAERAAAKTAPQYSNSAWDLVDAKKAGQLKLEEMKDSELPQEMKDMSAKERSAYVAAMQKKREALQKTIAALNSKRERYIKEQMQGQAAAGTLDEAIVRALRRQAEKKEFAFAK